LTLEEKDWPSWNFLHCLIKEQIEEENMITELIDRYNLIRTDEKISGSDLNEFDKGSGQEEADIARDSIIEEQ